jgi:hypothetical protein
MNVAIVKCTRQGRLPIPNVPPEKQAPIVALVEQILAAKQNVGASPCGCPPLDTNGKDAGNSDEGDRKGTPLQNPQTDIPALEAEIDRLVYALYGLTDEEIVVVEGRS